MLSYALRRILWTIPVLFVCLTILFGLMRVTAQSPIRHAQLLGLSNVAWVKYGDPRPKSIEANMKRRLGIDRPWHEQYAHYLGSVARLDFGVTYTFPYRTVNSILREQGPVTLELVLLAFGWAIGLGVPLGIAAALRRGTVFDRAVTFLTGATAAMPTFLIGTVLVWLLAVKLRVVPTFGWDGWRAKLLPSFVLSLLPFTVITRVLRTEMLEVLGRDHVFAARAKGLRRRRIVGVHTLRPAMIPVLSLAGPLLGQLVTGLFVVEWIFAIPGIGRYFLASATAGDYPLTFGLTAVLTMIILAVNAVSDITLAALDPRIRDA
ncbi:MAG TPA: ABC transporter permease [Gaiellaceae bacterium]|nr:ABC transporter permease [Gaiellaceae bacterium]